MKQYAGANISSGYIDTPSGPITSTKRHEGADGSFHWSWRTDADEPPMIWESVLQASVWIDKVWARETPKERANNGWRIVETNRAGVPR